MESMNLLAVGETDEVCAYTSYWTQCVQRERETPEADHSDEQIPEAFLPRTT